ncbi:MULTISPECIES: M20 family metallopeptidase [Nocardiopsis]|uniref:Amidohydrolase n=1 Tax=Nocardiopsis sinuspersici TaxID=501010 RepID=A0A1V3C4R1_9ACTN|nr:MULTISPECIES: M20 family metallopeptidase [Nocardiopsis]NYH51910.1 amidohydrolase [Nocardiopsis sinuspersici]OOC55479.1 N-acyl-L-amino acid amidohydrolase [Nocardiopsis sinuspersici]
MQGHDLPEQLTAFLARHGRDLSGFRRDLHMHPELAFAEHRTTGRIAERLRDVGLKPQELPQGTGLVCDIGSGTGPVVALRADIDALPLTDEKDVPYRSTVPGVAHACGHDVHTTVLLATGIFLAQLDRAGALPGRVRLVFQPAEELPGGAVEVVNAGALEGVDRIFALHCDPRLMVGRVGLRTGGITAACDQLMVRLSGPGGHTARPHLTSDLVYALGKVVTELPAALSRRIDPRAGFSLVWGRISAGSAPNVIPDDAVAEGTVRCLDDEAWHAAPDIVKGLVESVASAYGAEAEVTYRRGVPPTINESSSVDIMREAVTLALGADAAASTPQSLGGEDFAWYLEHVPGALARLGTHSPEWSGPMLDLHRGTFDVDERAIGTGTRFMATTALTALWEDIRRDGRRDGEEALA